MDDKYIGGIHGSVTEDSMYIDWLVADEDGLCKGTGIYGWRFNLWIYIESLRI
ncbi:hypothetical protein [Dethiothermospora halolimnae]|uniref:hypothetical protein n=1 Tax=Dethiothermospora halolimnae TaxID=3114390 RepID=UPI003CCBF005